METSLSTPRVSALSPQALAVEVARYIDLDPAFFLEQAALAGMIVFTDGQMIHYGLIDEDDSDAKRIAFLWTLMKASKSGKAVRELLIMRGSILELEEA